MKTTLLKVLCCSLLFMLLSPVTKSQIADLHDFMNTGTDGSEPRGTLISDGTYLYGTTFAGGASGNGIIFRINTDGTGFVILHSFDGSPVDGSQPVGSLYYDGLYLYGTTLMGGTLDKGTVFKIKNDGTGYTVLHHFIGGANDGRYPAGSLTTDGIYLYGMTSEDGNTGNGIVFKIKPDGTGYTVLYFFSGSGADGSHPYGSLIIFDTYIYLYGMTYYGGSNNYGVIFKIKTDGTGFTILHNFNNGSGGGNPRGSLLWNGSLLFGTTQSGGGNNGGNIFKVQTDGFGYANLHDFLGTPTDGRDAHELILDGTYLYGMTEIGGTSDWGTVFRMHSDGTGYTILHNFTGVITDGAKPTGPPVRVGAYLYGVARYGGAIDNGIVFKLDTAVVGMDEIKSGENGISIYPNPGNGEFIIQCTMFKAERIEIDNVLGEKVFEQAISAQRETLNPELPAGIYFVKVFNHETMVTKKLIIE